MFDEQPDGDPHGECAAEIDRLRVALMCIVETLDALGDHANLVRIGQAALAPDCPACKGSGERDVFDTTQGPYGGDTYTINCPVCHGTGAASIPSAPKEPK